MQIERHSPIKCYAGQSRDSEKLKHSASGAAFQMLAGEAISVIPTMTMAIRIKSK